MDVSPKTLREVEFREKMRGYHPEDVDQFFEQVAVGLEVLQDRLRQAVDRAQRAEAAASEVGGTDETLRKTLVLAQRTADLAVQEARDQAARLVASAEQQAQTLLSEAEERARRTHEEALVDVRADLTRLEGVRQQAQSEVELIRHWVEDNRTILTASLTEALSVLERATMSSPAPTTRPIDLPPAPRAAVGTATFPAPTGEVEAHPTGPETMAWQPPEGRDKGDDRYPSPPRQTGTDPGLRPDGAARAESAPHSEGSPRIDPAGRVDAGPRGTRPPAVPATRRCGRRPRVGTTRKGTTTEPHAARSATGLRRRPGRPGRGRRPPPTTTRLGPSRRAGPPAPAAKRPPAGPK